MKKYTTNIKKGCTKNIEIRFLNCSMNSQCKSNNCKKVLITVYAMSIENLLDFTVFKLFDLNIMNDILNPI